MLTAQFGRGSIAAARNIGAKQNKALNMDFLPTLVCSRAAFRRTASDTSEIGSNGRRAEIGRTAACVVPAATVPSTFSARQ